MLDTWTNARPMKCRAIKCRAMNCRRTVQFLARGACSACYMLSPLSQKRFKLGLHDFHRTVASSLVFLQDKIHPEILTGSPSGGVKQWCIVALRETIYFRSSNAFARWLTKLTFYRSYFIRIRQVAGTVRRCAFLSIILSNPSAVVVS